MNLGNPGLALSRNSGGSRAANADGAPRKHRAFHSSQPRESQSPAAHTGVILRSGLLAASRRMGHVLWRSSFEARRRWLAPQDDVTSPSFGNAPGAAANAARARALSSFI